MICVELDVKFTDRESPASWFCNAICCVIDGRFFGFEVKRPGIGKLTKLQEQTIRQINAAGGGFAAVVSTPADAKQIVERRMRNEEE